MSNVKHHTQGLRLLDYILEEKSWEILTSNEISDDEFQGDAKHCLKYVKDFQQKYGDFPPHEIVLEEVKVKFPSRVPKEYAVEAFKEFNLSKQLQTIFKSVSELAVTDPKKCLQEVKTSVGRINPVSSIKSFKSQPTGRYDNYKLGLVSTPRGVVPAWPAFKDAFGIYENGTINAIFGQVSIGKCVYEGTLCTTSKGVRKTIKQIVNKKLNIVSIDPKTGKVTEKTPTDWICSGQKECVELTFTTKDKLIVSLEHPILTARGWVKAGELKQDEPIARVGWLPQPILKSKGRNDDEIALIAAMLADGTMSGRGPLKYTKANKNLIQFMKETCRRLDIPFYKTPSQQTGKTYDWTVYSAKMRPLLAKYKIPLSPSNEKCLPSYFFSLPKKNLKKFISVFWSHDGMARLNKRGSVIIELKLSSEQMIDDIRHILLQFGIFACKYHGISSIGTDFWGLSIPSQEQAKFIKHFDILTKSIKTLRPSTIRYTGKDSVTKSPLKNSKNIFWDRVADIKNVGMQNTYDVSVADTHSFEAGYTHVHNSWASCYTTQKVAFEQNKKVLLISMENPKRSMEDRIEALYHKVPFGDIKRGIVDIRTEKYWEKNLSKISKEEGDFWVLDATKVRTVADINYHIASLKPDFVVVDGIYKVTTTNRGTKYEQSSQVLVEVEDLAKIYDIPILFTTQLNKTSKKAVGGRDIADEARGNQEYYMNSSTVANLIATDDDLLFNRVKFVIAKARDAGDLSGLDMEFYINCDRVRMNFDQMSIEDYVDEEGINELF